ncbi:hypothetical protein GCM10009682_00260 [Luedemannella flava]|uniref:EamA domain-containing protein n=1 Tax=Luedemannella flava TaxID=349316 RepID=A0ABP4XJZ3_9ACTN
MAVSRPALLAALSMLGAAALWGVIGGTVAGLDVGGAAAASAVELVTGVVLTGLAAAAGHRPRAVLAALGGRRRALLGAVVAVNVLCYYVALQLAPVGPVMAVHLLAPVLLTVAALVRGRRRLTPVRALSLAMVCTALLVIAAGPADRDAYPYAVVGLALSLVSAGCLAVFVTTVSRSANDAPPIAAAGLQMFVSGLLLAPALAQFRAYPQDFLILILLGLAVFAPACWLYWYAMRRLTPIVASTVLLTEPLFGPPAAALLYAATPDAAQVAAMALVLVATYLELVATT